MEINVNGEIVSASRLCKATNYPKVGNMVYNTVINQAFKGILKSVNIDGVTFIILTPEEACRYRNMKEGVAV